MTRLSRGMGVLALMVGVIAGCASQNVLGLLTLQSTAATGDPVIAGSLEAVAESAQAGLSKLGLSAVVTRKGEALVIASTTRTGARFQLVLTREKILHGEQTRIHVEWENGKDDTLFFQLFAEIAAAQKS